MNLKKNILKNNNKFNNLIKNSPPVKGWNLMKKTVIIVGSGNAALSAGIAALEKGADVTIYEKADKNLAGGNTKYLSLIHIWRCRR